MSCQSSPRRTSQPPTSEQKRPRCAMTLRAKSSPYTTMIIIVGLCIVAISCWIMFRDTTWILPLAFIATCGLPVLFGLYRLQLVLEDEGLSYRTLTRGTTVLAFPEIQDIKNETGRENVGDGPVAFSRLVVQLKTGEEIRINLQAFSIEVVHVFLQRLKCEFQDRGINYAELSL